MIRSLHVRNFQSHDSTDIDFSPGVNVIIGPSDSGKTALLRAVRWLMFNVPQGTDFRSNWGGDTRVAGEFDDCRVVRDKTKSANLYSLNDEVFKAFGRNVPEPIQELLNVSRINLLGQYDPPFMIGWTPGERGEFLNRICNFQVIDRGIKNANAMIRRERGEIRSLEGEEARLVEEKEALPDIEAMEEALSRVEDDEAKLGEILRSRGILDNIVEDLKKAVAGEAEFGTICSAEGDTTRAIQLVEDRSALVARRDDIAGIIEDIEEAQHYRDKYNHLLAEREQDLLDEFPDICPLCGGEVDEENRQAVLS